MSDHAILIQRKVVPCDLRTWASQFENADARRVAKYDEGGVEVSTVFLGLNHAWGGGPPLWFETMVFGGPLDGEQERCTTFDEAERQHAEMVERVKAAK